MTQLGKISKFILGFLENIFRINEIESEALGAIY